MPDPSLDFLQHLWSLNHAMERVSSRMDKTLGGTAQQRLLVRWIGRFPGITASALAAHLHLDPATVSVGLARMARKRLVRASRDTKDRRRTRLMLTERGLAVAQPHPGTVEHAVDLLLADLGPQRAQTVRGALSQLVQLLEAAARPPAPAQGARPPSGPRIPDKTSMKSIG